MFQRILLCTDGSSAAQGATDGALWFARKLGSAVRVLYVTDIRILEGPLLADLSGAIGAMPYSSLLPRVRQVEQAKAETILGAVAQLAHASGLAVETTHATGSLVHTVLENERDADLLVLGQRGEHALWHGDMLGSSVERIVRSSVKPCLVAPPQFTEPTHLLLAHDGSGESAKALRLGLDLAARLGAPVTLVTACPREHEDAASKILQQARAQASERKLTVRAQLVHDNPETAILSQCEESGANLIVMGAYGHTRIREWILGSTTTQVIRKTRVPVLLARGTIPEANP
jgi:nucleotide-binding universal stress UspA family protein